jgi:hypothetical protein
MIRKKNLLQVIRNYKIRFDRILSIETLKLN